MLAGGSPEENAAAVRSLLDGEPGVRRDAVLLNASAALVAAGIAADLGEGIGLAAEAVDTGVASDRLARVVEFSRGEFD
jgi:anthranilate phosphoribosyltransferase